MKKKKFIYFFNTSPGVVLKKIPRKEEEGVRDQRKLLAHSEPFP